MYYLIAANSYLFIIHSLVIHLQPSAALVLIPVVIFSSNRPLLSCATSSWAAHDLRMLLSFSRRWSMEHKWALVEALFFIECKSDW